MSSYRTWLDARGIAPRGPWVVRDSGGDPEGEKPQALSASASQNGAVKQAHRQTLSTKDHQS